MPESTDPPAAPPIGDSSSSAPPSDLPPDPLASYSPDITVILADLEHGVPAIEATRALTTWAIARTDAAEADYTLIRLSGEGGFGQVWEATQTSLDRVVALKMIKEELRGKNYAQLVESSFHQEAVTTARLEHPNIVPIYDLGSDSTGRPVLAMKFARGQLWTQLLSADFASMSFDDFLARHLPVLVAVAQAVAYAHSRGVIHRDIKSTQVMVGEYGEILLMDWGLALDMGVSSMHEAPQHATNPAGTVAYMAPEQTTADTSRIGPWTDVYLLGGVLYTLLTGSPVHPAAEASEAFSQARHGYYIDPKELVPSRALPEELVQLVRDALQPSVKRRIPTADQFLEQLKRYLSGAGRRADSDTILEHVGARLTTRGSYRDYTDALNEYARAAELWPGNPRLPGLREDAHEGFAQAALDNGDLVLARLQAGQLTSDHGVELLARIERAERAAAFQRRYRKVSVAIIASLGVLLLISILYYTRDIRRERDRVQLAVDRQRDTRERAEELLRFMLTDLTSSLQPIGKLELLEQIVANANAYFKSIPAAEMSDESRAQRANLLDTAGDIAFIRGDLRRATSAFDEAFAIRQILVTRQPKHNGWTADLARSHYNRGKMLDASGDSARALNEYNRSGELLEQVLTREPRNAEFRRRLGAKKSSTGRILLDRGNAQAALAELRSANVIYSELSKAAPLDGELRRELAVSHSKVGDAYDALGQADAALASYILYEQIMSELVAREPQNLQWKRELSVAHNSLGWAYRAKGDTSRALREFELQGKGMSELVAQEPGNIGWQRELAFSEAVIGRTLQGSGKVAEAVEHLRRSSEQLRRFAQSDPLNSAWQRDAAVSQSLLGEALMALGAKEQALGEIEGAISMMMELVRRDPQNVGWKRDLAQFHRLCGEVLLELRRSAAAEKQLEAAVTLMKPLTADLKAAPVSFLDTHASALLLLGRREEAGPLVDTLRSRGYNEPRFNALAHK